MMKRINAFLDVQIKIPTLFSTALRYASVAAQDP